jgi:hypothetical protein
MRARPEWLRHAVRAQHLKYRWDASAGAAEIVLSAMAAGRRQP